MRIGLDIDDVLYPWFDSAHQASVAAGIVPDGVIPTSWSPYEDYGCTREQWHSTIAAAIPTMYRAAPFEGAVEQVQRLKDAGHTVHLVTARGALENGHMIRAETSLWAPVIPHDSLTFSTDKTIVKVDFFLDDNYANWSALQCADVPAYLLSRPWNRGANAEGWRVETLEEFVDIVLNGAPIPMGEVQARHAAAILRGDRG